MQKGLLTENTRNQQPVVGSKNIVIGSPNKVKVRIDFGGRSATFSS